MANRLPSIATTERNGLPKLKPRPYVIATAKLAPPVTPKIEGSAKGLRVTACIN